MTGSDMEVIAFVIWGSRIIIPSRSSFLICEALRSVPPETGGMLRENIHGPWRWEYFAIPLRMPLSYSLAGSMSSNIFFCFSTISPQTVVKMLLILYESETNWKGNVHKMRKKLHIWGLY